MDIGIRIRLSVMMFLQYFVWGAWWVPFGAYLSANGLDAFIGTIFSAQGIAAIAAPLFVGAIADRYFAAERLMGVLHLAGGAALLLLSAVGADATLMFAVTLAVMLCYMPTIALSNAIAFNAMTDTQRQFPAVRVFGTLGWIVAGVIVGVWMNALIDGPVAAEQTDWPILMAGGASLVYGFYAFTLPSTPPRAAHEPWSPVSLLGLDAVRSGDRSFWVLIVSSLLLCIPLSFYYAYANAFLVEIGVPRVSAWMSSGQASEVIFLLALPLFFRWFGMKGVLLIGMLAWSARYLLFANGYDGGGPIMPAIVVGLLLHGICFDFFFVAGQIFVDKHFPPETRGRAQSFLALVTWGVGSVIGALFANAVYRANTVSPTEHSWDSFWLVPAALAGGTAILFLLLFRGGRDRETPPS